MNSEPHDFQFSETQHAERLDVPKRQIFACAWLLGTVIVTVTVCIRNGWTAPTPVEPSTKLADFLLERQKEYRLHAQTEATGLQTLAARVLAKERELIEAANRWKQEVLPLRTNARGKKIAANPVSRDAFLELLDFDYKYHLEMAKEYADRTKDYLDEAEAVLSDKENLWNPKPTYGQSTLYSQEREIDKSLRRMNENLVRVEGWITSLPEPTADAPTVAEAVEEQEQIAIAEQQAKKREEAAKWAAIDAEEKREIEAAADQTKKKEETTPRFTKEQLDQARAVYKKNKKLLAPFTEKAGVNNEPMSLSAIADEVSGQLTQLARIANRPPRSNWPISESQLRYAFETSQANGGMSSQQKASVRNAYQILNQYGPQFVELGILLP